MAQFRMQSEANSIWFSISFFFSFHSEKKRPRYFRERIEPVDFRQDYMKMTEKNWQTI